MFKNTILWTVITAIITALVYVELFITGNMFVLLLTGVSAIITIIISILEKKYIYILLNIILVVIALAAYVVMY